MTDTNCRDNPAFLRSDAGQAWLDLNKKNGSVEAASKFVSAMEQAEKKSGKKEKNKTEEEFEQGM